MQQIQNNGARYSGSVAVHSFPVRRINPSSVGLIARHMFLLALGLILLVLIAQLSYPSNRALPGSYFAGISVGTKNESQITTLIEKINRKQLFMVTETKRYDQTLQGIGIQIKAQEVAKQMTNYPIRERLVPFSFLWHNDRSLQTYFSVVDESKLNKFATTIASENNSAPKEGSITNNGSEFSTVYSTPGRQYLTEEIVHSLVLRGATLDTIVLPFTATPAVNTDQYLKDLVASSLSLAKDGILLQTSTEPVLLNGQDIIKAMRFVKEEATAKLVLQIDDLALLPSLDAIAGDTYVAPTANESGTELDYLNTARVIANALEQGDSKTPIVTKTLQAGSVLYPASSSGMSMIIDDWQNKYAYADPSVQFVELGGIQRQAGYKADKTYFSASLYKALVAWNILKSVEDGTLSSSATISGRSISTCIEQMIVVSDSTCAEARVANIGSWSGLDSFIYSAGVHGITMSSGLSITAKGYADFLTQLQNRQLMNEENTNILLGHMKLQRFRDGIPAGAQGEVADKVGYQPKLYSWHDGGIVYDPNSTYVLVVLGNGMSKAAIAELAQTISTTLNR